MNVTNEIDVLKKIVEDLTPLDADARQRVIDYTCKALSIDHGKILNLKPEKTATASEPQQTGKPVTPQQYLRDFNYKIMTKRIGVVAVYLERERRMKRFSLKDVTAAFRDAKESPPAHSQYGRAVAMDYLAKEGDQYYATSKAEGLVDSYKNRQADGSTEGE
jgi:hypothetical protein